MVLGIFIRKVALESADFDSISWNHKLRFLWSIYFAHVVMHVTRNKQTAFSITTFCLLLNKIFFYILYENPTRNIH